MDDDFDLIVPDERPPLTFAHPVVNPLGAGRLVEGGTSVEVDVAVVPSAKFDRLCDLIVGPHDPAAGSFLVRQPLDGLRAAELAAGFLSAVDQGRGAALTLDLGDRTAVLRMPTAVLKAVANRLCSCCTSLKGGRAYVAGELFCRPAPAPTRRTAAARVVLS